MPLPKENTEEWNNEVLFYLKSDLNSRNKRAKELGYSGAASYRARMGERGITRKSGNFATPLCAEVKSEQIIFNVPEIKLKEYISQESNGDEEIMILHCGDGHAGKITRSYNKDVYKHRMETIFDSVMIILNLHRHMYPIRKLHIINTGDNVQGENPYQGSKIGSVEMGAMDQVVKLALPCWLDLVFSLKQNFEEIEMDLFPGNHGRYSLEAPETSNWDLMLYNAIKSVTEKEKGIKVNVHEEFGDIVEINGFRFFCFHGDDIPCQQGVPFFALDKKIKSWHMQTGGFNYALSGHFHKRSSNEIGTNVEHFMCGSLVSDDEWALKKLGISSCPSQWVFGVHPHFGITFRYPLVVDRNLLAKI